MGLNRGRRWRWIGVSILIAVLVLAVIADVVLRRAGPIVKSRVEKALQSRFEGKVELQTLNVSVLHGLEVTGRGLRIFPPPGVMAAGATEPVIAVNEFAFHASLASLFLPYLGAGPMHVDKVAVSGLHIQIPPREMRQHAAQAPPRKKEKLEIVVNEITCDDSRLVIATAKPDKDPKDFALQHIQMREVGPHAPWKYDAILVNAIPRGDIHATGTFGPWQPESPGDSAVTGHYTFDRADLNTIKGIGGILSSVGEFHGQLDKIYVEGTTETPDFSLDTANHPLPLHTKFRATVDGTSGDTYLRAVEAKLRNSSFTVNGTVVNIKGRGHRIDLDVDIPNGQIRDFLDLAVRTRPAIMTGSITMKTKLQIRPGKESVTRKLGLNGNFNLRGIHFTNPQVQDKVDMLSLRAQGQPKSATPGAPDVQSQMSGKYEMSQAVMRFSHLAYVVPGGRIYLDGVYSLDGEQMDFYGKVLTVATLSQMVASRWKSILLKPVSTFFKKDGAGAEIPVRISGTKSEPKFGLDLFNRKSKKQNEPNRANK